MRLDHLPIAVLMQRRIARHPWAQDHWAAVGVVRDPSQSSAPKAWRGEGGQDYMLLPGLELELFADENEGYFENWAAPEPKVFVMWRQENDRPAPVLASVSYVEGTRMFDSGEKADGVRMPVDIHAWLGEYLRVHYQPGERKGRGHHG
ncbi:DUF3305 domain-containing protein [Noviherbaspirillum galbum]|uniref:DUF3305 domain-containing protein n=1 Tax=Noviherbaspirillum galbum TaxID=2709383 RepID=A0A6B3SH48_9BURK|nr:DUF3305 domain-containing protein [Noviherbaspirillum galbum]NEX59978.1 DUF3305 domain-containing protein [Noviherbaspirillum galbum]